MTDWECDDYLDGPDGAPALEHGAQAPELVRRIVADPGDESTWLAYAADLAGNGDDAEAIIVRTLWPTLSNSLLTVRSFDAVMADVRRNRTLLLALADRQAAVPPTASAGPARRPKWTIILLGLAVAVLVAYVALVLVPNALGPQ